MNDIREIPVPARLRDISARDYNQMVRACNRMNRLRVRPPLELTNLQVGTEIGLEKSIERRLKAVAKASESKTVLIVRKPMDDHPDSDNPGTTIEADRILRVRAVKYTGKKASLPTEPAPYAFDGDAFDALPYFGNYAIDYEGLEDAGGDVPALSDTFLECTQREDVWILQPPEKATLIRFARVVNAPSIAPELAATMIDVYFLKLKDGAFVTDGGLTAVMVWPKLSPSDYQQLATPSAVIAVVKVGKDYYAMQTLKWSLTAPAQTTRRVNC